MSDVEVDITVVEINTTTVEGTEVDTTTVEGIEAAVTTVEGVEAETVLVEGIEIYVPGMQGPPGSAGSSPYVFEQPTSTPTWHIVRAGLGAARPLAAVERDDDQVIQGFGVTYPDDNTVDLHFGVGIAGRATLTF